MSVRPVIDRLRDRVLAGIAAPVKATVEKAYMKKEAGGYCVDAQVVNPSTLEETGELLKEIPLSPIWMGSDGRGLFAPPEAGQIIVVGFVGFSRAHPFVAGFAGDEYKPGDGSDGALVLTDGKGAMIKIDGSLIGMRNQSASLKGVLDSLVDTLVGLKTLGPPSPHTVSPDTIASLQKLKLTIGQLFKD